MSTVSPRISTVSKQPGAHASLGMPTLEVAANTLTPHVLHGVHDKKSLCVKKGGDTTSEVALVLGGLEQWVHDLELLERHGAGKGAWQHGGRPPEQQDG